MPRLAVVIIVRNQAWNVDRLLASVARETLALDGTEVVVVDSASTDATVDVAARHPVEVLRLSPDQVLTPAAGRYVGYARTTGDFVLFLDGDMELCAGWLGHALAILDARPEVAAITGDIVDVPMHGHAAEHAPADGGPPSVRPIAYTGGVALHRRAVLDAVGGFNPYLRSDEEPELCLRIRHAGHELAALGLPAVRHYSDPPGALSTVYRRWRRGLYYGSGQTIRYHLHGAVLGSYLRERGYGMVPGVGLLAGAGALARGAVTRNWRPLGVWAVLVGGVVVGDLVRKRSLRATTHSLLERLCIVDGTIRGFFMRPRDPASYPARYDVVRLAEARR